jgi:hypothetical protein
LRNWERFAFFRGHPPAPEKGEKALIANGAIRIMPKSSGLSYKIPKLVHFKARWVPQVLERLAMMR